MLAYTSSTSMNTGSIDLQIGLLDSGDHGAEKA